MTKLVSAEAHDRDLERYERKRAAESAARADALHFTEAIHGNHLKGVANHERAAKTLDIASVYAAFILHGDVPETEVAK